MIFCIYSQYIISFLSLSLVMSRLPCPRPPLHPLHRSHPITAYQCDRPTPFTFVPLQPLPLPPQAQSIEPVAAAPSIFNAFVVYSDRLKKLEEREAASVPAQMQLSLMTLDLRFSAASDRWDKERVELLHRIDTLEHQLGAVQSQTAQFVDRVDAMDFEMERHRTAFDEHEAQLMRLRGACSNSVEWQDDVQSAMAYRHLLLSAPCGRQQSYSPVPADDDIDMVTTSRVN